MVSELGNAGEDGLLDRLPQPLRLRGRRALDLIVEDVCAALLYLQGNTRKSVLRFRIPDPGSGAFLTPGSRIRNRFFTGSRIPNPYF